MSSTHAKWWEQPNVHVLILRDATEQMLTGVRIEISHPDYSLPLEMIIQKDSPDIIQYIYQQKSVIGELCGGWVHPSARGQGVFRQVIQTAIEYTKVLGLTWVLGIAGQHSIAFFETFGFETFENIHQQSTYVYPDERYCSTLLIKHN